jgi:hypothetical protein
MDYDGASCRRFTLGSDWMEEKIEEKIAWLVWVGFPWVIMRRTLVVCQMLTYDVFLRIYCKLLV